MKSYLLGRDPARLEEMRFLIANPTASLYNNRTQILAARSPVLYSGTEMGRAVSEILGDVCESACLRVYLFPLSKSAVARAK
jgi:glucarate dehydratase